MSMTPEEFMHKYEELAHAIQTGIAYNMTDPHFKDAEPKHLRVGIDLERIDSGSLCRLLLDKGVITEEDYQTYILQGLHNEVLMREAEIKRRLGVVVKLH